MRVGEWGKVMGPLVGWDFGPQVCACTEWRPLARKIYTSRGLPLSQGGNPRKFSHTHAHIHTDISHSGLPLKCHTLDQATAAVFDMEMQSDLPEYPQGMQVVACESGS